jgi:protein-S-isoprenylcysteine O-methyltransferase Ste14
VGLVLDTWVGFAIGAALYVSSRIFAPSEERQLARDFPNEYPAYCARVFLPWL